MSGPIDMPIIHPPSFVTLAVVPFNINPHFPVAKPYPTHKGETREDRLREFHVFNPQPVVGLHEDGILRINGQRISLLGNRRDWLFRAGQERMRIEPGMLPDDLF